MQHLLPAQRARSTLATSILFVTLYSTYTIARAQLSQDPGGAAPALGTSASSNVGPMDSGTVNITSPPSPQTKVTLPAPSTCRTKNGAHST